MSSVVLGYACSSMIYLYNFSSSIPQGSTLSLLYAQVNWCLLLCYIRQQSCVEPSRPRQVSSFTVRSSFSIRRPYSWTILSSEAFSLFAKGLSSLLSLRQLVIHSQLRQRAELLLPRWDLASVPWSLVRWIVFSIDNRTDVFPQGRIHCSDSRSWAKGHDASLSRAAQLCR